MTIDAMKLTTDRHEASRRRAASLRQQSFLFVNRYSVNTCMPNTLQQLKN